MNKLPQDPTTMLMSLDSAVAWRKCLRAQGKKLVLTNGCFDIMHRGHAEYLYHARCNGDALLVLINSDDSIRALKGPTRPIIDEVNRAYMLASLNCVDAVVVFDSPRCSKEIDAIQPDVYVKGGDYTIAKLDPEERAALQRGNAKFVFIPFVDGFSSTELIRRIKISGC